jgi:hypothetical protein
MGGSAPQLGCCNSGAVAFLTHYSFRNTWRVDAPPGVVFDVLAEPGDYAEWWPEIKEVRRVRERKVAVRVRSLLPYVLDFQMEEARREPDNGVLEVRMTGDLEGFSRWTILPVGGGSLLLFEEEVHTNRTTLNRLAPVARIAFGWNHSLMMRHGEAGLRTYLAGLRRGSQSSSGRESPPGDE